VRQLPARNKIFFNRSQCPVFYSLKVSDVGFCMNESLQCLPSLACGILSYGYIASFLPVSSVSQPQPWQFFTEMEGAWKWYTSGQRAPQYSTNLSQGQWL